MLANLERPEFKSEIIEHNGYAIYLYIDDHIKRLNGFASITATWGMNFPYYHYNKAGEIIRDGSFSTGRPILTPLYELLWNSNFFKLFNMNIPFNINESHIDLVVDVINKSKKIYSEKFGNDNFFVLLTPNKLNYPIILEKFKNKNIKYIDISNIYDANADGYNIKGDGHPTKKANQMIVENIFKYLD